VDDSTYIVIHALKHNTKVEEPKVARLSVATMVELSDPDGSSMYYSATKDQSSTILASSIGPNDFAPRVGLLTRYGVVDNIFGADLYYHVILVKELGLEKITSAPTGTANVYF
jgi:hypothetical protein